jgi:hypothetical protein
MLKSVPIRWQNFRSKRVTRISGNFLKISGHSLIILTHKMVGNLLLHIMKGIFLLKNPGLINYSRQKWGLDRHYA